MSTVVAKLLVMRKTLMMTAAVVSSRCAPRMRASGRRGVSLARPLISGMTATPVSNPDRPRASLGKTSRATTAIPSGSGCWVKSSCRQSETTAGFEKRWANDTVITTRFSSR